MITNEWGLLGGTREGGELNESKINRILLTKKGGRVC